MDQSITARAEPLQLFRLTFSEAHTSNGVPTNPHASRAVLQARSTVEVEAPNADHATAAYERDYGVMVTACTRVQPGDEVTA